MSKNPELSSPALEEEKKMHKKKIVENALNCWEFFLVFLDNMKKLEGRSFGKEVEIELEQETLEMAELAGISKDLYEQWMIESLISEDGILKRRIGSSAFQQYVEYAKKYASYSRQDLETQLMGLDLSDENLVAILKKTTEINPLVGFASLMLYHQSANLQKEENKGNEVGWYKESLEQNAECLTQINSFFKKLKNRTTDRSEDPMLTQFVADWEKDVQTIMVEITNMANCFAIHVQGGEKCAVLCSYVSMPGCSKEKIENILGLFDQPDNSDGRQSIYDRYSKGFKKYIDGAEPTENQIAIPSYVSLIDTRKFTNLFLRFWKQLNQGLSEEKKYSTRTSEAHGSTTVELGSAAEILCRPKNTTLPDGQRAQARISLKGTGALKDVQIRIDREPVSKINKTGKPRLAMDVGTLKFEDALACAQGLLELDKEGECVMNYDQIVDDKGKIKTGKGKFYPSIMDNPALNSDAQKIALMVAHAMQIGAQIGTRSQDIFSYHARENISKPEYADNFQELTAQLVKSLS